MQPRNYEPAHSTPHCIHGKRPGLIVVKKCDRITCEIKGLDSMGNASTQYNPSDFDVEFLLSMLIGQATTISSVPTTSARNNVNLSWVRLLEQHFYSLATTDSSWVIQLSPKKLGPPGSRSESLVATKLSVVSVATPNQQF